MKILDELIEMPEEKFAEYVDTGNHCDQEVIDLHKEVRRLSVLSNEYAAALNVLKNAEFKNTLQSLFNMICFYQNVAKETLKTGKVP